MGFPSLSTQITVITRNIISLSEVFACHFFMHKGKEINQEENTIWATTGAIVLRKVHIY
jgi:hypothetical protein